MRTIIHASLLAAAAGLGGPARAAEHPRDAGALYAQVCAGCHDGGKGPAWRAGALKHGGDDASLARGIREGYPATGMPAFGAALSAAEVRSLVVLLRERLTRADGADYNVPIDSRTARHSELHDYRIETVVDEGLEVPWSFVFLPDGRILLTERAGRLRIIDGTRLVAQPVENVPLVVEQGEGGLMAVALHPAYAQNGWIYLSFSDAGAGEHAMTKIVRGRLRDFRFVDQETVFALPLDQYPRGYVSFGCRLVFADGRLFFGLGDRGVPADAQRLDVPNGKIHRVFDDGRVPIDNPFAGTPGAVGSILSYGHRNPQGLAVDPRTGTLWETEHGPRGGDELNCIDPHANYGWPAITYGINYDGTAITDRTTADGMVQPVRHWTPSIAVSQIAFYTGDRFPRWKNHLFLGSLAQQKFIRLEIEGRRIVHEEEIFKNLGRVRDIQTGPDGLLYVAIEQLHGTSGRIVRLVPAE